MPKKTKKKANKIGNATVTLNKLTKQVSKLKVWQKQVKELGATQKKQQNSVKSEMLKFNKLTSLLRDQIWEIRADSGDMEQRMSVRESEAVRLRAILENYNIILKDSAAINQELSSRTEALENLSRQTDDKSEALEQQLQKIELSLNNYLQNATIVETSHVQSTGATVNGHANKDISSSQKEASNVIPLLGANGQGNVNGPQKSSPELDPEVINILGNRLDLIENKTFILEDQTDQFFLSLEEMHSELTKLEDHNEALLQRLSSQNDNIATIETESETATGFDPQLTSVLQQYLDQPEKTSGNPPPTQTGNAGVITTEKVTEPLELMQQQWTARAEQLQADILKLTLSGNSTLEILNETNNKLQQIDITTQELIGNNNHHDEQTQSLASQLQELTVNNSELSKSTGQQGSDIKQLLHQVASFKEQQTDSGQFTKTLETRVDNFEQARTDWQTTETLLSEQNRILKNEARQATTSSNRIVGGMMAFGMMLFCLLAASYWFTDQQMDGIAQSTQTELKSLRQLLASQNIQLSGFDQQVTQLKSEINAPESISESKINEISTVMETQINALLEQNTILKQYQQQLDQTDSGLELTRSTVASLTQGQEQLLTEIQRLDNELAPLQQLLQSRTNQNQKLSSPVAGFNQSEIAFKGTDWLKQQNANAYTIQLVAAYNINTVFAVARNFPVAGDIANYQRQHNDKDWHVLLYGNFATFNQAKEALLNLPEGLLPFQPWIRKFSSVQSDIQGN